MNSSWVLGFKRKLWILWPDEGFFEMHSRAMEREKKWFKLFELKRKLWILWPDEGFFEMHSRAMEREKDKIWVQKTNL